MAHRAAATSLVLLLLIGCGAGQGDSSAESDLSGGAVDVRLPDGAPGIGFDDIRFSTTLHRVLVPTGRAGALDLIDPDTRTVTSIGGFSAQPGFDGGHDFGPTSVNEANGRLYVTDRTTKRLSAVDVHKGAIAGSVALAASPDYVRFVKSTNELWVSEPDGAQIEVFTLPASDGLPAHAAVIPIDGGGPESLVIDETRGRAYMHLFSNTSLAVDLKTRAVVDRFTNGCAKDGTDENHRGSRGIALDAARGFLVVACAEGLASVIDLTSKKNVSTVPLPGSPVDILDYDATLHHVYAPAGSALAILGLSARGDLTVLGSVPVPEGSHSVVSDGGGNAYVGDQRSGQLVRIHDAFPKAR